MNVGKKHSCSEKRYKNQLTALFPAYDERWEDEASCGVEGGMEEEEEEESSEAEDDAAATAMKQW